MVAQGRPLQLGTSGGRLSGGCALYRPSVIAARSNDVPTATQQMSDHATNDRARPGGHNMAETI